MGRYNENVVTIGQVFDRWTVINPQSSLQGRTWCAECQCICGTKRDVPQYRLLRGKSKSCGCIRKDLAVQRNTTHGKTKTKLFRTWTSILYRISHDPHYTERNIDIYPPWKDSFELFEKYILSTLGPRPPGCSLDRINNNLGYFPDNLKWSTASEQAANRTTSLKYRNTQAKSLIGEVINKIKVVEAIKTDKFSRIIYKLQCFCGNFFEARLYDIKSGHTLSCGCLKIAQFEQAQEKAWARGNKDDDFRKTRIKNNVSPELYWRRVNRMGWTPELAASTPPNKGEDFRTRKFSLDGVEYTTKELSAKSGIPVKVILSRINDLKWSVEDAITKPFNRGFNAALLLTLDNRTQSASDWGRELNIDPKLISLRKSRGCSDEEALSTENLPRKVNAEKYLAFGEEKTLTEWANQYNLNKPTLWRRLQKGIPLEEALTTISQRQK
jgi:hypothetical protein